MIFAITEDRVLRTNQRRQCSEVCSEAGRKQQRGFRSLKFREDFFQTCMERRPPCNQPARTSTSLRGRDVCERGDDIRMPREPQIVIRRKTQAALAIKDAFRRADCFHASSHAPLMN